MKTTTTYNDSRINRNNNAQGYMDLTHEIVLEKTGIDKEFSGWNMTYDSFKTTGYKNDSKDSQVDVVMDFNNNTIVITVDTPEKSKLEEEMEMWEARANDEFGTILKSIEKAAADSFYAEPDEFGILSTPISHYITAYSLDGNRKYTAKVIYNILQEYDIFADRKVKKLADQMMTIAQA